MSLTSKSASTTKVLIAFVVILGSSVMVSINSDLLQSVYLQQLNLNKSIQFLLKFNLYFFSIAMSLFWVVIIYLIHLFAVLFGGEGEFLSLFYRSSLGFIFLVLGGIVNYFLVQNLTDEFNLLSNNLSIQTATNQIIAHPTYKVINFIGYASQIFLFFWFAYAVKEIYRLTIYLSLLASILVLAIVMAIEFLF